MFFSKSFGYAVRGVLYIAVNGDSKKVQLHEMSKQLGIPRHFMGKVMKKIVKNQILDSTKGPHGGFSLNSKSLETPLIRLLEITGDVSRFDACVLGLKKCKANNPCPLHHSMIEYKKNLDLLLSGTTIGYLVREKTPGFMRSIASL